MATRSCSVTPRPSAGPISIDPLPVRSDSTWPTSRQLSYRPGRTRVLDRIEALQQHKVLGPALAKIPKRLRRIAYAALVSPAQDSRQGSPWAHPDWSASDPAAPEVTLEMDLLGRCGYKLPDAKARALLGYEPIVGFDEGMRRTLGWLRFAGFPVSAAGPTNP